MAKVVVGMSGGVDSAVAALLLKEAGYEVIGLTLRTWEAEDGMDSRCCEIDDAANSARKIGIEYHTLNCLSEFKEGVVEPFIDDYVNGYTPNPCVICNRIIKWERLLYFAKVVKADYVATGHYATIVRLDNGRYSVRQASHIEKDQTYMLYRLSQEQLSKTLMPLGDKTKEEVRQIAKDAGIAVANKPDSQEICFVSDGVDTNEVVLCKEEDIYSDKILIRDVNYVGLAPLNEGEEAKCFIKVRYHHKAQSATIKAQEDGNIIATFDQPVRAASPGQSAVFYDSTGTVLGGGVIEN